MNSTTKIRIVLASVSVLFLILIGYLIITDYIWTVQALIIGSFAFFGTFTISSNTALFATLLIFGIFILPFIFNELGFLDDSTDEQPDDFGETGQSIEEAEEQIDRLIGFLKSRFGSIKKVKRIRNYPLPIGITSAILGGCLITLPSIFLTDSELIWIPETEEWFVREYYGFIRGHLLLIGILMLVVGLILVIRHIRHNSQSTINEKLNQLVFKLVPEYANSLNSTSTLDQPKLQKPQKSIHDKTSQQIGKLKNGKIFKIFRIAESMDKSHRLGTETVGDQVKR